MAALFSRRRDTVSFEHFFGDLAAQLIGTRESEIAPTLQAVMQNIGQRYGVDRIVLRWLPTESQVATGRDMEVAVGWRKDGKPIPGFTAKEVPWAIERLLSGEFLCLETLEQLPSDIDRHSLESKGIESLCALPLHIDDDVIGAFTLAYDQPYGPSKISRSELESLGRLIASTYWSANYRRRIRTSEARYRAVVQDQSDLILRWTPNRTMTWVNDRMCEYVGKSADELIGKSELLFMTEDEWRAFEKDLLKLTPETPTFQHNHHWIKPNGEIAWNEWTVRGIFNQDGELVEAQSVGRDITARKLAEEALARQAAFQTLLADISSNLLLVPPEQTNDAITGGLARIGAHYGIDRAVIRWYDDVLQGFGVPSRWARDESSIKAMKPEEFPHGYEILRGGKTYRIDNVDDMAEEAIVDRENFRSRGLQSIYCLPLTIEKKVLGFAGFACRGPREWDEETRNELQLLTHTATNAVVRQLAMIQISRREADLARSQRVANVGSYRLRAKVNDDDPEQLLNVIDLAMSDQALDIFGLEKGLDGRTQFASALSRIHADDLARVRATWRKTLRQGAEHTLEYRVVRPDGSVVHVQSRDLYDSVDENGVVTVFGTCEDITRWVDANRQLQIAFAEIKTLKDRLQEENLMLKDEVRAAHGFGRVVGTSSKLRRVLEAARQVAPTDVAVLICGETGTGKELIARSIHDLSDRKAKPMVSVNCAALSADLIESELFGHEKGAFTGAHARRKGRFELADGGTLFLDEIGEMSGDLQAKLLRVIQEGEFERLGGSTTLKTDVRLIAATNRDLVAAMDSGDFRADLYYRINAFPIDIPPLRDRKEDIPELAAHFVRKHAQMLGKDVESVSARTIRFLQEQYWSGNVREMESTILRALISTNGRVLDYVGGGHETRLEPGENETDAMSLLAAQRQHIVKVLTRTGWVIEGKRGAARVLGLAPSSLRSKMKRLNISRPN